MALLSGKKIVLGVTGSIAAYKAVYLLRLLQEQGAEVRVIMTAGAEKFVSALTFATLSKQPVFKDLWDEQASYTEHVKLGGWGDILVIAPCSANTLAKIVHGLCDNALTAVCLSAKCPLLVAPAMDLDMFAHPQTQANLDRLKRNGHSYVQPESGYLASGLNGKGRLAEPEVILEEILATLSPQQLSGKKVLITGGPTQEDLDPVRFFSNRSTGKMAIALAKAVLRRGGVATLVLGPTSEGIAFHKRLEVVRVQTAQEMFEATTSRQAKADAIIMAAAVSDYRPKEVAEQKIKSGDKAADLQLALEPTKDILAYLGQHKPEKQLLVGFALETNDEEANAKAKLEKKNLDMIVLNSLKNEGAGFGHDTNQVSILSRDGAVQHYELKSKDEVAVDIAEHLARHLHSRKG